MAKNVKDTAYSVQEILNNIFDDTNFTIAVDTENVGGRASKGKQNTTITTSTAETTIVTAGGAGVFNDVYGLILTNTSGSACNVTIKDSTGGTTVTVIAVPAGETRGFMLPRGSAVPQTTSQKNWTATCSASITSMVVTALYSINS